MEQLITRLSKIFGLVLVIFCILQVITYQQVEVVIGCCVSLVTYFIFSRKIFNTKSLKQRPISFVAVLGVILFTYFAPIMTYIEMHPITYNMISPVSTYLWQLLYVLVTFAAYICTGKKHKQEPIRHFLLKIGYFDSVSNKSLWILGLWGMIGRFYLLKNQFGEETTSGAGTVNLFLIPFLMAPYCILFRPLFSKNGKTYQGSKVPFLVYTLVLLIIAVATNARNNLVTILMSLLLMTIFYGINYREDILKRILNMSVKKTVLLLFAFFVFSGPFSDFAIAMVAVRYMRSDLDAKELFVETFSLAMDSEKMAHLRKMLNVVEDNTDLSEATLKGDWNESYVSNVFMNRLCNYQVADASIYHANRAGVPCQSFIDDSIEHMKILFPKFMVEILFGDIDKDELAYSPMDFLYAQSTHSPMRISYIVGGDVGLGLAFFGYLFPLFQFLIYILIFRYLDSIAIFDGQHTIIPVLTLISIYSFFYVFFVGGGILGRLEMFFWAIPAGVVGKVLMIKAIKKIGG